MNFPGKLKLVVPAGLLLVTAALGQDQQPPNNPQPPNPNNSQRPWRRPPGRGFRRDHGAGRAFGPATLSQLNLSDAQQQQIRTITQQSFENTKAQREELRQLGQKRAQGTLTADDQLRARTLHQQIRSTMRDNQVKIEGLLNTDQKTKLNELRAARREGFGKRRGRYPGRPPGSNASPVNKPANPTPQP